MTDTELLFELYKRLDYDRERGELRRKAGFTGITPGALVGSLDSSGKLQATFLGKRYQVDALIWFMEHGFFPEILLHKNENNLDSCIGNLQHATRSTLPYVLEAKRLKQQRDAFGVWRPRPRKTPEEKRETARIYRENNRELYRNAVRNHHERNKNNPVYRSSRACRQLLNRTIMACKFNKTKQTEHLLGYTFEEFKKHIESMFVDGMTWTNHGEWHVDHVKPLSLYIAEGITDPAIINALSNLQPLPAIDNLIKGPRYVADRSG